MKDIPRRKRSTFLRAFCAAVTVLAVASCASSRMRDPARDRSSDAEIQRHVRNGYIVESRHTTASARDSWVIGGESVGVPLMLPSGTESYPLVVYLPGLGESTESGVAWRRTWAEAGYAVLSVQAASEGSAVWSSGQARLGEFGDIARQHFSAASLAKRVRLLGDVFTELARRKSDSSAFGRIDLSRIAVTGFDLGAQTAMVVAGEHIEGVEPPEWPHAVKAVIALSPYADFSGMGMQTNFRPVRLPVLGVTSAEDTDAYGLVTSAMVRRAPFEYMPPGRKYMLVLVGAPHSLLSGRETQPDESTDGARAGTERGKAAEQRSGGGRGRRGLGGRGSERPSPASVSPAVNWRMELADAEGVTLAYLDATVKDDAIAREWLQKDAQRWLGDTAQLLAK